MSRRMQRAVRWAIPFAACLMFALPRPARAQAAPDADRVELQNVKARFPAPDLTGHYRAGFGWGYVQAGGAVRYIAYDDLIPNDQFNRQEGDNGRRAPVSQTAELQRRLHVDDYRVQFSFKHSFAAKIIGG